MERLPWSLALLGALCVAAAAAPGPAEPSEPLLELNTAVVVHG